MAAPKFPAILFTDEPIEAKPIASKWTLEGRKTVIRDARFFDETSVEDTDCLAFYSATNSDDIEAAYLSKLPDVKVVHIPIMGSGVPKSELPPLLPTEQELVEQTPADDQLNTLGDDDLKALYVATFGNKSGRQPARDSMLAKLREAEIKS